MELSFAQQSAAFLYSFVLGAMLAAVYGIIKFFRFAFSWGKAAVMAADIAFMLLWALSVFFFSLAFLYGYIRFYVFLGSFAAFLAVRLTLGRIFYALYSPLVRYAKKILHKICRKLKIFANYLLKIAHKVLYNIVSKKECFKTKRKKHLKKGRKHETKKAKNQAGNRRNTGNRRGRSPRA